MTRMFVSAVLAITLIFIFTALRSQTVVPRAKPAKIEWLTVEQAFALNQNSTA